MTLFGITRVPRFLCLLWFGFLTLLGGIWAYYRVFSGFSFWDDEGSLMTSVKQYLDGSKLYDQVWSAYGPVYYFYNWLLRSSTGTSVTHDVVRISSLLPWLVTALACAWIILRVTDSLVLATLAHLLTLYSLQFFASEPGHPQELCILLLVGSCRERYIDRAATLPCGNHFVRGVTRYAPVDQDKYRHFCNSCDRPVAELSFKTESDLEDLRRRFRSREPVSPICSDEAPVGEFSGTYLLCSGDRVCSSV